MRSDSVACWRAARGSRASKGNGRASGRQAAIAHASLGLGLLADRVSLGVLGLDVQYVAAELHDASELGPPWLVLPSEARIYAP